jgi:hypothetical protein
MHGVGQPWAGQRGSLINPNGTAQHYQAAALLFMLNRASVTKSYLLAVFQTS